MKRISVTRIIASLAVVLCLVAPAHSQNRATGEARNNPRSIHRSIHPGRAHHRKREFAPRVIGRANSFIVRGRIVALRGPRLSLETARGAHLDFHIDEQTTLLDSSELLSLATMDDIRLRPADLRLADEVEVVAERAAGRCLARIITRTATGEPVARR